MKYRAKIYIRTFNKHLSGIEITSRETFDLDAADWMLVNLIDDIEQATGGHIEKYVDGIGWVVFDEDETK